MIKQMSSLLSISTPSCNNWTTMKTSVPLLILVAARLALGSEQLHSSGRWRDAPDSFFDPISDPEASSATQDDTPEEPEAPQTTVVPEAATNNEPAPVVPQTTSPPMAAPKVPDTKPPKEAPTLKPTPKPTEAPTVSPTASICAKRDEPCFDMETLTYTECCVGMKCLVDKSANGDFGTRCVSSCEYLIQ